jgi:hypothetical protein
MSKKAKPSRSNARWSEHEASALVLGIKNHTAIEHVAEFLRRPVAAVFKRLHTHHRDVWLASGHPQCHPWKSEGMAKARAAKVNAATEEAPALRVVPDPPTENESLPPWASNMIAMMSEQTSEIASLRARVAHLEAEWGIKA